MKKLLILGTSYGSVEIVKYAKSQGIYTIVTDFSSPYRSIAKKYADKYWMISTGYFSTIEHKCREEKIDGITCGEGEFNLEMTMALCDKLNLPRYCMPQSWQY